VREKADCVAEPCNRLGFAGPPKAFDSDEPAGVKKTLANEVESKNFLQDAKIGK
jgi:hypothetical protein